MNKLLLLLTAAAYVAVQASPAAAQPAAFAPPVQPAADMFTPGIVVAPRVGFILFGTATQELECTGSGSLGAQCVFARDVDGDDRSLFGFAVDGLYWVMPELRLGLGVSFVPVSAVEPENGSRESQGSDLSAMAVVEGVAQTSPKFALFGRLAGGLFTQFYGGQSESRRTNNCNAARAQGGTCSFDDGPFVGWTLGGGAGLLLGGPRLRFRADLAVQYYRFSAGETHLSGLPEPGEIRTTATISGIRPWLLLGAEF